MTKQIAEPELEAELPEPSDAELAELAEQAAEELAADEKETNNDLPWLSLLSDEPTIDEQTLFDRCAETRPIQRLFDSLSQTPTLDRQRRLPISQWTRHGRITRWTDFPRGWAADNADPPAYVVQKRAQDGLDVSCCNAAIVNLTKWEAALGCQSTTRCGPGPRTTYKDITELYWRHRRDAGRNNRRHVRSMVTKSDDGDSD